MLSTPSDPGPRPGYAHAAIRPTPAAPPPTGGGAKPPTRRYTAVGAGAADHSWRAPHTAGWAPYAPRAATPGARARRDLAGAGS
jgi:hypothetical protein